MRSGIEREFFDPAAVKHDAANGCFDRTDCPYRDSHIRLAYVLPAMRDEIAKLRESAASQSARTSAAIADALASV